MWECSKVKKGKQGERRGVGVVLKTGEPSVNILSECPPRLSQDLLIVSSCLFPVKILFPFQHFSKV